MSSYDEKRFEQASLSSQDGKTKPFDVDTDYIQSSNERAITRIFDLRIIPVLWFMYLVSSADRANIGFALTMNSEVNHSLKATVGITDKQASLGIALFYVGYTVFEIPSNLIITKLNPASWLARICISWGAVTAFYALINNAASFYTLRLLLGIAEAGLFPGMAYYLTKWYRKSEISTRIAFYFFASPTSTIITGFISAAVQQVDGAGGLYAWKWLFIIFGIATILIGIFALFWLPAGPAKSKGWLTDEQKELATQRLLVETEEDSQWTIKDLINQFKDYKVYLFGLLYTSPIMVATSIQYSLPTIIQQLLISTYGKEKVTGTTVSLLAIPPSFMVILGAITVTMASDRYNQRALAIIASQLLSVIGFFMLTFSGDLFAKYIGSLIIGFGIGPLVPLAIGWTASSKDGSVNVAAATAIVSSMAQFGTIAVTYALYTGWPSDAPDYVGSNMVNVGLCFIGIVAAVILKLDFMRLNKHIEQHGQTADGRKVKYLH